MIPKLCITITINIAYYIDKELYIVIEYINALIEILTEQLHKQNKLILLIKHRRIQTGIMTITGLLPKSFYIMLPDVSRFYSL